MPKTPDFKPVASAEDRGVVKFFGRVREGGSDANRTGEFGDIGDFIVLDEDVNSGDTDTPPWMALNINVPDATEGSDVQIQVIYYETSEVEYIQGGDTCFDDPDNTTMHLDDDDSCASSSCGSGGLHERRDWQ